MPSYKEITAQIAKLTAQAEQARQKEVATVVAQIHSLVKEYGVTPSDLGLSAGTRKRGSKTAGVAKYRNSETGATWTGRGRAPAWIGKDRSKFEIKQ